MRLRMVIDPDSFVAKFVVPLFGWELVAEEIWMGVIGSIYLAG